MVVIIFERYCLGTKNFLVFCPFCLLLVLILSFLINRLNSSDTDGEPMYIQMVTALVLQLIQCVVHLPSAEKDSNSEEESNKKVRYFKKPFSCVCRNYLCVFVGIICYYSALVIKHHNFMSAVIFWCMKNADLEIIDLC